MFLLNNKAFLAQLVDLPEAQEYLIPDGMTEQELDYMLRILQAKTSAEIDDISTDDVIKLFEHISSVAKQLKGVTIFDNIGEPLGAFEQSLIKFPSAFRRRVL